MYNSFVSVVSVINTPWEKGKVPQLLQNIYNICKPAFSDFEIILVNNVPGELIDPEIDILPEDLKHQVSLINLSNKVNKNNAMLAGLDRSNGDYTVIFDVETYEHPEIILQLFEKTREHFDVVYMRAKARKIKLKHRLFYRIFYYIIRNYSQLKIDENALNVRIISRRALNSLLRLRENLRYMKAIYSIVGFKTTFIETDLPLQDEQEKFTERFQTLLVAVSSFTTFLRSTLLRIFLFSILFLVGVVGNALKVKFTGIDIFGTPADGTLAGWTFLVVLMSVFFAITCLNLYIMSIYLSNIYNEIKQRPLYLIESIKRF
jgi:glucosyltransferase